MQGYALLLSSSGIQVSKNIYYYKYSIYEIPVPAFLQVRKKKFWYPPHFFIVLMNAGIHVIKRQQWQMFCVFELLQK